MQNNIRKYMGEQKIRSYGELGLLSGVSREVVKNYAENRSKPALLNALLIACALHKKLDDVFVFEKEEKVKLKQAYDRVAYANI